MQQSYLPKAIRHLEKAIYAFGGYQRIHSSRTEATPQFIIRASETLRTDCIRLEGHEEFEGSKYARGQTLRHLKEHVDAGTADHPAVTQGFPTGKTYRGPGWCITDDPDQGVSKMSFRVWTASIDHSSEPEMTDDKFTETPFAVRLTYRALPRIKSHDNSLVLRPRLEKQYHHYIELDVLNTRRDRRPIILYRNKWEIDHRTKRALFKRKKENKRNTIVHDALQEAYEHAKAYHSNHHLEEEVNIYLQPIEAIQTARKSAGAQQKSTG